MFNTDVNNVLERKILYFWIIGNLGYINSIVALACNTVKPV